MNMKQKLNFQQAAILWAACSIIVVWLGILASDCCEEGVKLTEFLSLFSERLQHPFRLSLNGYTVRCVFAALCMYALAVGYYYTSKGNKRTGEEYGSAKWGDAAALNRKYRDKTDNIILSQHISMGLDGRRHKRNLNGIVVGGSGAGKTRGYDGIDLPGDACRMLVIDGLPPLNSIKDRYIQSVAPQSTTLLREQVQRIEQGMGRGVRSNDDECCVVLMGDELTDVLSRNKGIDYFSAATRCQYDLSKQLWDLLVSEKGSKPTIDQIFELANYSLEKDAEWVTTCKESLAAVRYSNEAKVDEKIVAQRKAFERAMKAQWTEAANAIKIVKDKENDRRTKGYLCQIQAEYTNKIDSVRSQEILKAGKGLSAAILLPISGIQYQRAINTIPQAQAISTNLVGRNLELNELLIYIDGVLSNLCIGSEYEKFEEALNQIGTILGFACSRPDKETGGYGPDNLWAIDSSKYLVIECKTEATTQTIKKDYCNQLSGSVNWFKENYVYPNECIPIMVHPSKVVDAVASPDENMRVITEKELEYFRKNIRDFYSSLCQNGNVSDVSKINELLRMYKLRKDDIINMYTVKFERKG